MSTIFGGNKLVLPADFTEIELPCKSLDAIAIGDLLYIDTGSSNAARPVDLYVGSGTALTDRIALKSIFAGVALQGRLATQTGTGYPANPINAIRVANECLYEATIASGTYNEGDLVGFVSAGGGVAGDISAQTVVKVNNWNEAIGYVWKRNTNTATTAICRLFGRLTGFTNPAIVNSSGYATYAASGAITQKSGLVEITKAGVGVMTLADPTSGTDDGKNLIITSTTANAHTVTASGGLKNGGAAVTIFTFTGTTAGGGLNLWAAAGKWNVVGSTGGAFS